MSERPQTVEDMQALPVGPAFGMKEHVIDGKLYRVPFPQPTKATWFADDEPMGYTDDTGNWQIGQYADGSWYRRRMG